MTRRLVGVALKHGNGLFLSVTGTLDHASKRRFYPTRTAALLQARAIGGRWKPVAIYWTRKPRGER